MSAPAITSITFDKTSYNPGDTITATVNYGSGTSGQTQQLTGTATDAATGQTGTLTVNFTVNESDSTSVSVKDTGGRVWTKVSDAAGVAKFTATA